MLTDSRIKGLSRKSPSHHWVVWANSFVAKFPNSLDIREFILDFKNGLGIQNIRVLEEMELLNTGPKPEESERVKTVLDPIALIILMHQMDAPLEARLIITDFFHKKGILNFSDIAYKLFDSPGEF